MIHFSKQNWDWSLVSILFHIGFLLKLHTIIWSTFSHHYLLRKIHTFPTEKVKISRGSVQFSCLVVSDSLCPPWTATRQASLSITNSQSLFKLMSIESVMPSNHLILCRPLFLLSISSPSIFPSIRVFSNESALHQVAKLLEFQLQHQSFQ